MRESGTTALRKLIGLRRFPLFTTADVDEVATVAENVTERSFAAGAVMATQGGHPRAMQLLLDGCVESVPPGRTWTGPTVLGALEVFADKPLDAGWVAVTDVRVLEISASTVGELLEDNIGVLRAVVRELGLRLMAQRLDAGPTRVPAVQPLGLVERLLALRQQLPFKAARLQALTTLAKTCHEVSWLAGEQVISANTGSEFGLIVLDGELVLEGGERRGPGSSLGLFEAIAGVPHQGVVHAATPVRALRTTAAAIFDVIEDHTDVGLAMIATFAAALLERAGSAG